MPLPFPHLLDSFFHVYQREDLSSWEHEPTAHPPIYSVYHVYCAQGWERLVNQQLSNLRQSGLLDATSKLYVSIITQESTDIDKFLKIADSDKVKIIANHQDPRRYEYPALEYLYEVAKREDCLLYYFHTKGISYQALDTHDRLFRSFQRKIEAWREMLEYFTFCKWQVAVNVLTSGYDTYGCYQWPPRKYTMFTGNFWWVTSSYARRLPAFDEQVIANDRFYSEVWLYQLPSSQRHTFSAFETIADLYFVRMPRSLYAEKHPRVSDFLAFILTYNWRKFLKHVFGYNYKHRCQRRYQELKESTQTLR